MTDSSAKDIRLWPISSQDAAAIIRRLHYSGTTVRNSQLHFGVFLGAKPLGAMQFGPPMDKRKLQGLVSGTGWNGFLELNRMAFDDRLPRNSESRAISIALRMIRKRYPHIEWVASFADATQCGDGAIYRAAGFVLTGITRNKTIWSLPDGSRTTDIGWRTASVATRLVSRVTMTKGAHIRETGGATLDGLRALGGTPAPGFQLRYVYFLNPATRARLTVPVLPFSRIDDIGAGMYRGRPKQAMVATRDTAAV